MTTINLSLENFVNYDVDGYAYPECPICDKQEFNIQLIPNNKAYVYCNNDNFTLHWVGSSDLSASFNAYAYTTKGSVDRQEKQLDILYKKGFMGFEEYIQIVLLSRSALSETS